MNYKNENPVERMVTKKTSRFRKRMMVKEVDVDRKAANKILIFDLNFFIKSTYMVKSLTVDQKIDIENLVGFNLLLSLKKNRVKF